MIFEEPEQLEARESLEDQVAVDLQGDGLNLNDLRAGKGTEFEVDPESVDREEEEEGKNTYFDGDELFKHLNYEVLDNDDDEEGTPFERMRKEMEKVTKDEGVMKKILKHGAGPIVPPTSLVRVNYNAYLEYEEEPFDSSRLRGKQHQFKLGVGEVIRGLELSICTMRRGETSRFMITHEYGFGKLGCPPRIPAERTTLFEVELVSFVDQEASDAFQSFSEEERKQASFEELLKVVDNLRLTGNEAFSINQIGRASNKYSQALRLIENARLQNEKEEQQMKEVSLKLFLNLSLCDLKQTRSGRACKYARKALDLDRKNVKALFRLAQGLRQLGEFEDAKKQISKAHRLDPRNKDINAEMKKLDEEMLRYRERNQDMAKKMLNLSIPEKIVEVPKKPTLIVGQMAKITLELLKKFKDDPDKKTFPVPSDFTEDELVAVKQSASDLGLYFYESGNGAKSCVTKTPI